MKKLLLIPTLVTTGLAPLVAFTSCGRSNTTTTTFIFDEEGRHTAIAQDTANLSGFCNTKASDKPTIVSDACHFENLKHRDYATHEVKPYDTRLIKIKVEIDDPTEPDFSYGVRINLTHVAGEFPAGEFFFNFVIVWYENGDYHHIFEQTIDSFFMYRV